MRSRRLLKKSILFLLVLSFVRVASAAAGDGDLLKRSNQVFGPLPGTMQSEANPITPEKVKLGKILFYESRISADGTVSCARCHPIGLYAADGLRKSIGNNCRPNPRNDPTILNAADQISAHWIGNRKSVEDQAKQSVIGPPSFGMPSYDAVEEILRGFPTYRTLFKEAFPGDAEPVTIDNFAKAIGAFERTLVTPSPFDAFLKGDAGSLSELQKKGLETFMDAGCAACHSGTYLGGQMYQKFGIFEPYAKYTRSDPVDEGRFTVTKNEADRFVFKVPVLRNVEKTPPYFHDGSVETLKEAVRIMGKVQLGTDLTGEQIEAIRAFLISLTGNIPEDALIVPLLPSRE